MKIEVVVKNDNGIILLEMLQEDLVEVLSEELDRQKVEKAVAGLFKVIKSKTNEL